MQSSFSDEDRKSIRMIERLLKNYPYTEQRINRMQIQIEMIEHDYDMLHGASDNQIKASTKTNETHDISDNMVRKEERINKIKDEIFKERMNARMIENAISALGDDDRKFIEDRYFNHVSPKHMADSIYFCTETWIFTRSRRIIRDKLLQYIDII